MDGVGCRRPMMCCRVNQRPSATPRLLPDTSNQLLSPDAGARQKQSVAAQIASPNAATASQSSAGRGVVPESEPVSRCSLPHSGRWESCVTSGPWRGSDPWRKGPREQFCRGEGRYRQGARWSPSLRGKSRGRPPVPPLRPANYPRRRESSLGTRVRRAARFTVEKHTSSRSAPGDGPHDV